MARAGRVRARRAARRADRRRNCCDLLPAGGARNAARLRAVGPAGEGSRASRLADSPGCRAPRPVTTAFTLGLGDEADAAAQGARGAALSAAEAQGRCRAARRSRAHRAGRAPGRPAHRRCQPGLVARAARAAAAGAARPRRRTGRATGAARRGRARSTGCAAPLPLAADESCTDRRSLAGAGRPLPVRQHQAGQVRRPDRGARHVRRGAARSASA